MKTKLTTILIIVSLASSLAIANERSEKIQCLFTKNKLFGLSVDAGAFSNRKFLEYTSPAQLVIHGPRLYLPYKTVLVKAPISTRTIVGVGYYADLGRGSSINLSDINYAPVGYEHEIGFKGIYLHQNGRENLICKHVK